MLLVNDEPFLLHNISTNLENDFDVKTAENGLIALRLVMSQPLDYFDVILLDINMPVMNGFEAC